jgi:FHS family L-fucose permease-like MFS transporter
LFIGIGVFAISFFIISAVAIPEPQQNIKNEKYTHSPMSFRHCVLGVIAIFFYVGVEIGIPAELNFYISNMGFEGASAIGGALAAVYWFLMMIGRFVGASIGNKVSSRAMITTVSILTLILVSFGMFAPTDITVNVPGIDWGTLTLIWANVPVGIFAFLLVGLCTSVMWGGIFNMAVEGLGKYTAAASGIFMTMVFGCAVMLFIQAQVAEMTDYMTSYWVVLFCAAYLLFYALVGSKVKK